MKHLGTIKNGDQVQDVYAKWDGEQVKYMVGGDEVAVYDPDVMEDPILFMSNTKANELSAQAKEQIQSFAENVDLEELKTIREKYDEAKQEEIADALGIERSRVRSITEIDLDQKVKTNKDEPKKEEPEKEEPKKEEPENSKDPKQKEKEALTTKDVKIKQELKMNAMATDMKTIGRVLQKAGKMPDIPGKTFTKLGIVESSDVKNAKGKTNTTRFSLVAIASDGSIVPLDLQQDKQEGNNPREISYQTRADGSIEQDDVLSRYTIGNSGETISIKHSNGPGYIEVGYSPRKTLGRGNTEGNVSMDTQLETRTVTWRPNMPLRQSEFRGDEYQDDRYAEIQKEVKSDSPQMQRGNKGKVDNRTYEDIDGREETKSEHNHIDIKEIAKKIMDENEDIANVFTQKEVEERLNRAQEKGEDLRSAEKEMESDADRFAPTKRR